MAAVGVVFVAVVPWCRNRRQCKRDSCRNATMSQVLFWGRPTLENKSFFTNRFARRMIYLHLF